MSRSSNRYSSAAQLFLHPSRRVISRRNLPVLVEFGDEEKGQLGSARLARNAIIAELTTAGSTLTPYDVLNRTETQTCVGCHFIGGVNVGDGLEFPAALKDLQHVSEDQQEGDRFAISNAMRNVFIRHRMKILHDYLATGKAPVHSN